MLLNRVDLCYKRVVDSSCADGKGCSKEVNVSNGSDVTLTCVWKQVDFCLEAELDDDLHLAIDSFEWFLNGERVKFNETR
jgi:hypothetical protein